MSHTATVWLKRCVTSFAVCFRLSTDDTAMCARCTRCFSSRFTRSSNYLMSGAAAQIIYLFSFWNNVPQLSNRWQWFRLNGWSWIWNCVKFCVWVHIRFKFNEFMYLLPEISGFRFTFTQIVLCAIVFFFFFFKKTNDWIQTEKYTELNLLSLKWRERHQIVSWVEFRLKKTCFNFINIITNYTQLNQHNSFETHTEKHERKVPLDKIWQSIGMFGWSR